MLSPSTAMTSPNFFVRFSTVIIGIHPIESSYNIFR
jgi:hypothetical protein